MAHRVVLSTHIIRRRASSAQAHYEGVQEAASLDGPAGEYARQVCAQMGLGLADQIEVRPAKHERAKWIVASDRASS